MNPWHNGYVTDINYTYGYYSELNPQRLQLALAYAGIKPPKIRNACELGFGQGLSINIHAAASDVAWWGNDFNPSQAAFAQNLAAGSGAKLNVSDDSFEQLIKRDDLPQFDYIGLHGIWSWINEVNREAIVRFIQTRLAVGGVVYVSYNTMPGWATFAPIRHLMRTHVSRGGVMNPTSSESEITSAIEHIEKLLAVEPIYGKVHPSVSERVKKLKDQSRQYLAHEYFNNDWHPMFFTDVNQSLKAAKLLFAASANYLDQIDPINLTPPQIEYLQTFTDPTLREQSRDFLVNQQFRRDYWVKGKIELSAQERLEYILKERLVLVTNRNEVSLKVNGALGEATMAKDVYEPILDAMKDHKIRSIAEIVELVATKKVELAQTIQACMVLVGQGSFAPAQDDSIIERSRKTTTLLNRRLIEKSKYSNEFKYLACPVTGGAISVGRVPQLFLGAYLDGKRESTAMAEAVWAILDAQGQRLIKDGKTLQSASENLDALREQSEAFLKSTLPMLVSLQLVSDNT